MKGRSRPRTVAAWSSGRAVRFAISVLSAQGIASRPPAGARGSTRRASPTRRRACRTRRCARSARRRSRPPGTTAFGLHIAEQVRPAVFDALGYVFRSSRTLGSGLRRLAQYHRFIDDVLTLGIETAGLHVAADHATPPNPIT